MMIVGLLFFLFAQVSMAETVTVGSKAFTEGFILSELAAQTIENSGQVEVIRRFGMGGTGILFEAITNDSIDLYVEYTGTISEAILKNPALKNLDEIKKALDAMDLVISQPLGFNNTYALAISKEVSKKYGIKKISDLSQLSSILRASFSHEFVSRADGLSAMTKRYAFMFSSQRSVEHSLSYEAIAKGEADIIDVYSTDAKIEKLDLVVLEDDLEFFPKYEAVFLARKKFVEKFPQLWLKLKKLEGSLSEAQMVSLNAEVDLDKKTYGAVISRFLNSDTSTKAEFQKISSQIWQRTQEHLVLVGTALIISVLLGVPLGILAVKKPYLGQAVMLISSLVQTIPSLALLCFLIPFFGIGEKPALVALCLYGLLPIILNTFVGLKSIELRYLEASRALGLTWRQSLQLVEIPIAASTILAGIKTSTIIGIGTATLAALIGAGGFGVPIVTGLAINDMGTILTGAIPAAVMALLAHIVFEIIERV